MKANRFSKGRAGMMLTVFTSLLMSSFMPALAAEPINIGFTTDFSGPTATLTMVEAPVVEMVVKEVNAAGGINGRPINLITQDNASDPAKVIGIAKMFKEKYKCKVIIAGPTSSVCIALKNWADQNHVPVIAIDPQSDKLWVKSGKSWFFRSETPASPRVEAILARLKKLGHTKVAFEGTTLAWGTDTLASLKARAPSFGITIVSEVLVEPKSKDLSIQAKKLKDSGAQAVICAEYDAETVGLARAMKNIGWNPYVIHTSAANLMNALALADPAMMAGWETIQQIDPHKPLVQNTWSKTKEYAGKAPLENEEGPRAMDGINLLVSALKLSGNPDDSTAIRDAFYKIRDYERVLGKTGGKGGFTEGKNHLLDVQDLVIYTVKGGKLVPAK